MWQRSDHQHIVDASDSKTRPNSKPATMASIAIGIDTEDNESPRVDEKRSFVDRYTDKALKYVDENLGVVMMDAMFCSAC